jgi:hypothetical protein
LNLEGKKEALSLVIGNGDESAKFWLKVLNDLRNRGVQTVCVVCCDGLTALPDAIERVSGSLCKGRYTMRQAEPVSEGMRYGTGTDSPGADRSADGGL